MLPPSPLPVFRSIAEGGRQLRTGYTHAFEPSDGVDRSAAAEFRSQCRSGSFQTQTSGCAPGFVQANFVALPREHAFDFLKFCLRNPRACPLLDVTDPGDPCPRTVAPSADVRTDMPKYRVWRHGELTEERADISELWDDSMVGFLLGCSFSWEKVLQEAGLTPRQIEQNRNVPMYRTSLRNNPVGPFAGDLVVSMRPYAPDDIARVAKITGSYPGAHGAPIHWGEPEALGIADAKVRTAAPDWGEKVDMRDGELPVFWACGVTPHAALMEAKLPLAITHAPGHMFICDIKDSELAC
jgi:uncharacterized protein YcsI (UPF0317 family)